MTGKEDQALGWLAKEYGQFRFMDCDREVTISYDILVKLFEDVEHLRALRKGRPNVG